MRDSRTEYITTNAIIAALYVCLTAISPLSYGVVNIRFADIIPVVGCLDKRYRIGVTVGLIIANMLSPYGIIDVACAVLYSASIYVGWIATQRAARVAIYVLSESMIVALEICMIEKIPFLIMAAEMLITQSVLSIVGIAIYDTIMSRIGKNNDG